MAKKASFSEKIIRVILAVLIIALIALIFLIVKSFFDVNHKTTPEEVPEARNVIVADSEITRRNADSAEVDSVASHDVKMNSLWNFKNGSSVSNDAYVANPSVNVNDVYFEIFLNGTDKCIFKSPVIPVGSHLENISLDQKLAAGSYECNIKYTLLGSDGASSVGTIQLSLRVIIKS